RCGGLFSAAAASGIVSQSSSDVLMISGSLMDRFIPRCGCVPRSIDQAPEDSSHPLRGHKLPEQRLIVKSGKESASIRILSDLIVKQPTAAADECKNRLEE